MLDLIKLFLQDQNSTSYDSKLVNMSIHRFKGK